MLIDELAVVNIRERAWLLAKLQSKLAELGCQHPATTGCVAVKIAEKCLLQMFTRSTTVFHIVFERDAVLVNGDAFIPLIFEDNIIASFDGFLSISEAITTIRENLPEAIEKAIELFLNGDKHSFCCIANTVDSRSIDIRVHLCDTISSHQEPTSDKAYSDDGDWEEGIKYGKREDDDGDWEEDIKYGKRDDDEPYVTPEEEDILLPDMLDPYMRDGPDYFDGGNNKADEDKELEKTLGDRTKARRFNADFGVES